MTVDVASLEIPERLQKFELWKGVYPVHYTVMRATDGTPDFKVIHEERRMECILDGLCALCGERLEKIKAFIGGEACMNNKIFLDPGMHKDCAYYAAKACPFLNSENREYASNPGKVERDGDVHAIAKFEQRRPKRMAIMLAKSFDPIKLSDGGVYVLVSRVVSIDWDAMPVSS